MTGYKVWKYKLDTSGGEALLPLGSRSLHFAIQDNTPCVWAEVPDRYDAQAWRKFRVIRTGGSVPAGARYIGTAHEEVFVWHLYELIDEPEEPRGSGLAKPEPAPTGEGKVIFPLVIDDIEERAAMGKDKYGTYLRANNGRKPLVDAYQEALDLVMYLRQKIEEEIDV